jgi:hypothetical protein
MRRQRVLYGLLQFYYPSVAVSLLLGNLATAVYMLLGVASVEFSGRTWLELWGASMVSWFLLWCWLRRYNIARHEREEIGVPGMALAMFAGPVYVSAALKALARRPMGFAVTAKGRLRSNVSLRTFRLHLLWAAMSAGLLAMSLRLHHDLTALRVWCLLTLFIGLAPPVMAVASGLRPRRRPAAAVGAAVREGRPAVAALSAAVPAQRAPDDNSVRAGHRPVGEPRPDADPTDQPPPEFGWWIARRPAAAESGTGR